MKPVLSEKWREQSPSQKSCKQNPSLGPYTVDSCSIHGYQGGVAVEVQEVRQAACKIQRVPIESCHDALNHPLKGLACAQGDKV